MAKKKTVDKNVDQQKRSFGIDVIAWLVIASNGWMMVFYYLVPLIYHKEILPQVLPWTSAAAVFPYHFFKFYLTDQSIAFTAWMLVMALSGVGLLLRNRLARMTFIVLNIIHIVILATIVFLRVGQGFLVFVDYFFRLYFNLVASGVYVGFLTIVEVREQFLAGVSEEKFIRLFVRPHLKEPTEGNVVSYYNLGAAYRRLERYDEAADALKKAMEAKPADPRFHFELGMTYLKSQKFAEATLSFQEVVRLDPIFPDGYCSLGVSYAREGCYAQAIEALEKASHVTPARAAIYRDLGRAYAETGAFKRAAEVLRRAVALDPRDGESCWRLGKILLENENKPHEARAALLKSVRLRPKAPEGFWFLGLTCLQLDRLKDALRAFKEVLRLDPEDTAAHYHLGVTYSRLGDQESARRVCKNLRAVDADLARELEMMINARK